MKKKVFVGISGGVDSAVSASILLQQGYDVTGVFMKNWSGEDYGVENNCPWEVDQADAIAVCTHLGIRFKTYNFETEYRDLVIENFFEEYTLGNTPNPDILCNKFIKFDYFLKKAQADGADLIATGHYAYIKNGHLFKAADDNKDQTYFLSQVDKSALEKTLFPLGKLTKPEVRKIAHDLNLPNADRKDSQGICFVGKVDIREFLSTRLKETPGDIIDADTEEIVGSHNGVWFHTIGQRKGLMIGGAAAPYFVASKDVEKNILYVVSGHDHPKLYCNSMIIKDFKFIDPLQDIENLENLTASIRYRSEALPVTVKWSKDKDSSLTGEFRFEKKQWAVSLGQSLVLYSDKECLGGGIITKIL